MKGLRLVLIELWVEVEHLFKEEVPHDLQSLLALLEVEVKRGCVLDLVVDLPDLLEVSVGKAFLDGGSLRLKKSVLGSVAWNSLTGLNFRSFVIRSRASGSMFWNRLASPFPGKCFIFLKKS